MKCSRCNQELPQDSVFCQYCGSPIVKNNAATPVVVEPICVKKDDGARLVAEVMANYADESARMAEANKGIHNMFVGDRDFGLVPEKPIYTKGIDEQGKYLKMLRTTDGRQLKWNRRGSMSADGVNGLIDIYEMLLTTGEYYQTIYMNMYGSDNSTVVPVGFAMYNPIQTEKVQGKSSANLSQIKKSKAPAIIAVVAVAVIVAGLLGGFVAYNYFQLEKERIALEQAQIAIEQAQIAIEQERLAQEQQIQAQENEQLAVEKQNEENYKKLTELMLKVTSSNYASIGTLLNELPMDYQNVAEIKTEYNQINKYITTIKNATLTEKSCNDFRDAYAALIVYNDKNHDWDLSAYIDDVYTKHIGKLIFGKEWEEADPYHSFHWYGSEDGQKFSTNLPNDKDEAKSYYFILNNDNNPTKFGYQNQKNSSDKFYAYEILDISYKNGKWQMKVYCTSDRRTYILE